VDDTLFHHACTRAPWAWVLVLLGACGPSIEGHVEDLDDPELRESARQELLLAKERAVEPLLEALAASSVDDGSSRGILVEVIAGLMTRVDDDRLGAALANVLRSDSAVSRRIQVAHFAAIHRRVELSEALLDALDDAEGAVRHEALLALSSMEKRLTPEQVLRLDAHWSGFQADAHPGVRLEALIRAERGVATLIAEAERAILEARLVAAESLYAVAVIENPFSRRARYREARYYYDNGDVKVGLDKLRRGGMLLDVPRLTSAPIMDGTPDDTVWGEAARADSFYQFSFSHSAALPTRNPTTMWIGYTDQALYVAFRGQDAHPDSLVANFTPDMAADADTYDGGSLQGITIWKDDMIELFLDADFDHRDYAHIGINNQGVRVDEWIRGPQQQIFQNGGSPEDWNDASWRASDEVAAAVADDGWSVEYRLEFSDDEFPRPMPGTVWGFNLVRVFRGEEYSQWVRTYSGGHSPNDFGVLRFQ